MKKALNIIVGILMSALFVYLVFRKIDFAQVLMYIKNLNYFWIIAFSVFSVFTFYLRGYRWNMIAMDTKKNFKTTSEFFKYFVIGNMFNNILPLRIGDLVRAYLIGKKNDLKQSYMLGTVIIERAFDVLSLIVLLSVVVLLERNIDFPPIFKHLATLGLVGAILGFTFIRYFNKYKSFLVRKINSLHQVKILRKLTKFINSVMDGFSVLNNNHHIVKIIVFSLVLWIVDGIPFYLIGNSFGFHIGIFPFMLVMICVCFSTLIPSGPGYVGVFEGACIFALGLFGVDKELAVAYALVLHLLQIVIVTITGLIFCFKEKISLKNFNPIKSGNYVE